MIRSSSHSIDKRTILAQANGRWLELFVIAGISESLLTHDGKPCPKCGGTDRFNADRNVASNGKVFCRMCFTKTSAIRPGDGFATVAWWRNLTYAEAITWVADQLGMTGEAVSPVDIIKATANAKGMPLEAFLKFGVKEAKRDRGNKAVARVNVYNERGEVHSYIDLSPDCKGFYKGGKGNAGLGFPGQLPVPGETWLLVEGIKDAAALVGFGYLAAGLPTNTMNAKYAQLFKSTDIIVVPDLDTPGMQGAQRTASRLAGIARSVRIARLPGELRSSGGVDVRDVLKLADGKSQVQSAIEQANTWEPNEGDESLDKKPQVVVSMEEAEVSRQVIQHLGTLGWEVNTKSNHDFQNLRLFVRGGVLVHVIEQEQVGDYRTLLIRDVPTSLVRERITEACRLVIEKETEHGVETRPTRPPSWLVDGIFRRGHYYGQIKPLAGIIESPTLRVNGSIIQTPGYDDQTGLIFKPLEVYPQVDNAPTHADAKQAVKQLLEVIVDFPMQDDADRSAWLAYLLTLVGRPCIAGNVPLFAVTANIRGAGKSLLVDTATLIAFGHRAARKIFTRNDDEMRKVITAVALAATPSVLFDNVDIQMGGASLDAAITSSVWSDRVLGQSRMTGDLPMRVVWSATGNNLAFGSDLGRRVLPIRLKSNLETPETRTGFHHPDLLDWVEKHRTDLAVAALTLLRAYFVAGTPRQDSGDWGSFESWSNIVRGAIVWAGAADPLTTRETALASDDTVNLLRKLIVGISQADKSGLGLTTKEIEQIAFDCQDDHPGKDVLADAINEICGERFNSRQFGRRVRNLSERVWNGQSIHSEPDRTGVQRWRVRKVNAGFEGFEGLPETQSGTSAKVSQRQIPSDNDANVPERSKPNPANHANPAKTGHEQDDWGEL